MKIEIIGGSKKFRDALRKKIAAELDPKDILATGVSATRPTNVMCARNRSLSDEYIDPDGLTDDDAWYDSTIAERMETIEKIFGKD